MKIIRETPEIKLSIEDIEYISHSNFVKSEDVRFGIYDDSDNLIGKLSLYNLRPSNGNVYISIYIKKEYRSNHYGSDALKNILKFLKNDLRFHRVTAEIYDYNVKSIKLFEKFGFELEGKIKEGKYFNGKYHDILIFGKVFE